MSVFNNKVDRTKNFEHLTEDATEEEKREAELALLRPADLCKYPGKTPKYTSELASRTALIVFHNKAEMDLIGELFEIRTSVSGETYITNIMLLKHIAEEVKTGNMAISKDKVVHVFNPDAIPEIADQPDEEVHVPAVSDTDEAGITGAEAGTRLRRELKRNLKEGKGKGKGKKKKKKKNKKKGKQNE